MPDDEVPVVHVALETPVVLETPVTLETPGFGQLGLPLSRRSPFFRGFFFAAGALTALVIGLAVSEAATELELVLIAAFLAIGLNPVVSFAQRRGLPRAIGVFLVALLAVGLIAAVVFVLGSVLQQQVERLIAEAPHLLQDLRDNRTIAKLDHKHHVLSSLQRKLQDFHLTSGLESDLLDVGESVLTVVVHTVIVFVLTLYFLANLDRLTGGFYKLVPASRRERVTLLTEEILRRVGRYAVGALFVAAIAGTVTVVLLFSVGLGQYALALGLLVALLDLVPLVGSLLGASVVCLIALATSGTTGIVCIAFYIAYETLEGYVIYPRVMRSSVDVPEYLTIIAVLVGGAVDGIIGALLALPIAAAVILLVREVWMRRQAVA